MTAVLNDFSPTELPGRRSELDMLLEALDTGTPQVLSVHGIGGIGKSTLVERFADLARDRGAVVVQVDARHLSPTAIGLLTALAAEFGLPGSAVESEVETQLRALFDRSPRHIVVVIDDYELVPLIDTWVRQHLVRLFGSGATLVLVGREPLHPAWQSVRLHGIDLGSVEIGPLSRADTEAVLLSSGVPADAAAKLTDITGGHPMSIWMAVDAIARHPDRPFDWAMESRLAGDLAAFHLDGLDTATRGAVEAMAVVRRGTSSALAAMVPDQAPGDLIARLERLPFVERRVDGLAMHGSVRDAITLALEAQDPVRHAELRTRAWRQIREDLQSDPTPDTWRYTADLLFLIENPILRNGFFPVESAEHRVQQASSSDTEVIADLISHEHPARRATLGAWRAHCPDAWKVAIDRSNQIGGCALVIPATEVPGRIRRADPIVAAFERDRRSDAVPPGQLVLYLRAWLSQGIGELPSAAQAALWLDCKRIYLDQRHTMRRLYTATAHPEIFLPVLEPLGFDEIEVVDADGGRYHVLRVDFGPGGVNGWLGDIASRELGIDPPKLLDPDGRTLTLHDGPVPLTPLEYGVLDRLIAASGRPVSRVELIADVWGHTYTGGSNVVDAVVRTLRRKMGVHSIDVETVRGIGYRYVPT